MRITCALLKSSHWFQDLNLTDFAGKFCPMIGLNGFKDSIRWLHLMEPTPGNNLTEHDPAINTDSAILKNLPLFRPCFPERPSA
jgi:hypothetical protein